MTASDPPRSIPLRTETKPPRQITRKMIPMRRATPPDLKDI
jgi:hypothetical protein